MSNAKGLEQGNRAEAIEEAVLSAILQENAIVGTVGAIVDPRDFSGSRGRLLYAAALRLDRDGSPVDPHTLEAELARCGELDAAGGIDYIAHVLDAAPGSSNALAHARLIRERAQRLELSAAFEAALRLVASGAPPAEIAAEVRTKLAPVEASAADGAEPLWYALADLIDDPSMLEPPAAVAPPIAWRGRLTLLVGREKRGGKSTAACAAIALASRAGQRTLYVSMDEPLADTVARLHRFGADPSHVFLMTRRPSDLGALVAELAVGIVVIDALSVWCHQGTDSPESGDSKGWNAVMLPLVALARTQQVALVLIQHANKGSGEYRDSTSIGANSDIICTLEERKDGTRAAKIEGRFAVPTFTVRMGEDHLVTFVMDECAATRAPEPPADEATQRKVLELLQSAEPEGLKATVWEKLAKDAKIPRSPFYRARGALYKEGHLTFQSRIYRVSQQGTRWLARERAA